MSFLAGLGKQEITAFIPGLGMMGYGQPHNTIKEKGTALWARVLYLENEKKHPLFYVHLEQAFVSMAIKEKVLAEIQRKYPDLKLNDGNLLITAQHTHSAPGGFSHYPFYNFTIPGFQIDVFTTVVNGILGAIEEAYQNKAPALLHYGEWNVSPEKEVAFNRSLDAHLKNPEAKNLKSDETHLGIDRKMKGLHITDLNGKPRGFFNWFGVHCTSISSYNNKIHHDNKGIAADLYEKNHPGVTAFFAQGAAGDVSPNFIWDKSLKRQRGKFQDQYESVAYNGELQFREAEKLKGTVEISPSMETKHIFIDMTKLAAPPAHGVAFFQGTLEGPGVGTVFAAVLRGVTSSVKKIRLLKEPTVHQDFYEAHAPKDILLDHRDGSFIGVPLTLWKLIPPIPDPVVEAFRKEARKGSIKTLPWIPPVLPLQTIRLGSLLIVAVPGEITTIAAQRLRSVLMKSEKSKGVVEIVITSYANAYMGYITTPQEYATQSYEGGHTVYGPRTLHAIITGFEVLLSSDPQQFDILNAKPFQFPSEELAKRSVGLK